jgi:hypothetical protein
VSEESGDFYLAIGGQLQLATSGDLYMAAGQEIIEVGHASDLLDRVTHRPISRRVPRIH